MNKNRDAGEREHKNAEELTLVSVASLIPIEQMDGEYAKVLTNFNSDIAAKIEQRKVNPDAVTNFLVEKYLVCEKLQKEKGSEMYKRGVEALSKKSNTQ